MCVTVVVPSLVLVAADPARAEALLEGYDQGTDLLLHVLDEKRGYAEDSGDAGDLGIN